MPSPGDMQKKGIIALQRAMYVGADDMNSSMNMVQTYQGGLGMGQRDYYLENDEQTKNIRNKYQEHIAKMFQLAGLMRLLHKKGMESGDEYRNPSCQSCPLTGRVA